MFSQPKVLGRGVRFAGVLVLVALCCGTARGGLIGASVNLSVYYPNLATLFQDGGNTTVSGAVEYPSGTFSTYNSSWQIDITDTQMIITNASPSNGFPFASGTFNGFVLTILSGPAITGAVADGASAFSPAGISIVGNQLRLNYQGVSGANGTPTSSIIDITTGASSVPEPASWTMLLVGAGLLPVAWRKRARR